MRKLLLFLMVATLGYGNVYSQAKKTPVKRTNTTVSAKTNAKAEEEAIAKAQAEAQAKAAEAARIEKNNEECYFGFDSRGLYSGQNPNNDFIIYEIPNKSASELKAATISAVASLFKSPKDMVTILGDNIILFERYVPKAYYFYTGYGGFRFDILYSQIIQFKDGKVRYDIPSVKQIWSTYFPGKDEYKEEDMSEKLTSLINEDGQRRMVVGEFNRILDIINEKIKSAKDW